MMYKTLPLLWLLFWTSYESSGQTAEAPVMSSPADKPVTFWLRVQPVQYFNLADTFVGGKRQRKKQVAEPFVAAELLLRANLRHNRYVELGYGLGGLGSCMVDVIDELGLSNSWVFPTEYVPLRVGQYFWLGQGPFYLAPSLGLLYVHPMIQVTNLSEAYRIHENLPDVATHQFLSLERNHFLNYEGGLTAGIRLRRWEASLAGRYCNSFGRQYAGQLSFDYTQDGVAQAQIISKNRLEAWSLALGVSYQLIK